MTDGDLQSKVGAERVRASLLEARLSPRRALEAAELDSLASAQTDAHNRTLDARRTIAETTQGLRVLKAREQVLAGGLTRPQRSWLRVGEPVLAASLLFLSLTVIGAALDHHLQTALLEVGGFALGLMIALRRRGP